jgi:hypothetical protein
VCENIKQRIESFHVSNNIGLSNTKRRLQLKYENRYILNLNELNGKYIVILELKLN